MIAPFGSLGGSELMLMRLLRGLDDSVRARVLLLGDGPFAEMLRDAGHEVEIEPLPGRNGLLGFPAAARAVAGRLKADGLEVIHANQAKAALFALLLRRHMDLPVLWMKHDHYFDGHAARFLASRCERVVCVSEAMAAQFGRSRKVSVVYPGAELPPRQTFAGTRPLIVALGRLDPHKGFDDILRATAILRDRGVDATVHVAGLKDRVHPEHAEELERLAHSLGLGPHCRLGFEKDVTGLLSRARVLCMASRPVRAGGPSEGAPTVLMEAMAFSRPSVAPHEPGIAEVMGDAGTLVRPVTPTTLANALEPYLRDEDLAAAIGARGRERAEQLFDMKLSVRSLADLYRGLAASRAATASATSPVRAAVGSLRRRLRS